jgi:hypothetical protein
MILIDGFEIDAVLRENHEYESTVTDYPLDEGSDASDHVINKPVTITLDSVVSDTPIGALADRRGTDTLPSSDAIAKLRRIRAARQPIVIVTTKGVYSSVVMQSLRIPVDANTGAALAFTAVFKQLYITETARTTVKVAVPRVKAKTKKGSKPTKAASTSIDVTNYGASLERVTLKNVLGLGR